ncbi:MAG TPA: hypothetical protein VML95_09520 [Longimicrobiales bacterium]|nr:hypothetical protein [Longimicrobiales bacterium]
MTEYDVDSDVPPPDPQDRAFRQFGTFKYPWAEMGDGDSFFVPADPGVHTDRIQKRILQAGRYFRRNGNNHIAELEERARNAEEAAKASANLADYWAKRCEEWRDRTVQLHRDRSGRCPARDSFGYECSSKAGHDGAHRFEPPKPADPSLERRALAAMPAIRRRPSQRSPLSPARPGAFDVIHREALAAAETPVVPCRRCRLGRPAFESRSDAYSALGITSREPPS